MAMKLTLDHIQAKGMKDTSSMMDVQDPIMHINIGKAFLPTEKKNNCRKDATFDAVLKTDITREQYESNMSVDIELFNESMLGTSHIGRGSIGLKTAVPDLNQHVFFVVPLIHYEKNGRSKEGKPHGEVVIRAFLEGPAPAAAAAPQNAAPAAAPVKAPEAPAAAEKPPAKAAEAPAATEKPPAKGAVPVKEEPVNAAVKAAPATAVPNNVQYDESKPLVLKLDRLQARDLKDKGGSWDKQDPALRITVGDTKPFDTERQKDAGIDADFPEYFELPIPVANFTNNLAIEIEAFNVGGAPFYSRTSLGKARVPLNSLINTYNEHVPVTVDLMYDSQKSGLTKQGRVMMRAYLEKPIKEVITSNSKKSAPKAAEPAPAAKATPAPAAPAAAAAPATAQPAAVSKDGAKATPAAAAAVEAPAAAQRTSPALSGNLELVHHLFISEITAKDLKNVEMMFGDRNDPYVVLQFANWDVRTPYIDGAGAHATWRYSKAKDAEMRFAATTEELQDKLMTATVTDKNHITADKLIGSGEARLPNALMPQPDLAKAETVTGEMVIPLKDEHGKAAGSVLLMIERETTVREKAAAPAKGAVAAPVAKATAKEVEKTSGGSGGSEEWAKYKHYLFISRICGKGLRNVEMMFGDKNDDYMLLKFGQNTWSFRTAVIEEGGSDPIWEYNFRKDPQMKFAVSLQELQDPALGVMHITAMDKNNINKDAFIGEGSVALPNVPGCTPQKATEESTVFVVTVPLADAKGKPSGSVELTVERSSVLRDAKPAVEQPAAASEKKPGAKETKPFDQGNLLVTRIVCQELPNVEGLMGKNDVFVQLQLGPEERKTEVLQEGGANVCFDFLNYSWEVDKGLLDFEKLKVAVYDANNLTAHTLIGQAESSVRFLLSKVEEEGVQLPLALKNAAGKDAGKMILFLTLKPAELRTAVEAPMDPSFQSGLLHINRVRAFDLQKAKTLLGGTGVGNPFVKLTYGSWNYKTQPLSLSSGASPIFDNLDLAVDVTAGMLQSTKLVAEVWDSGMTGATLVGSGECSVRDVGVKVGEERQFTIDLVNKGATAGKLVVFALAAPKKKRVKKEDVVVDKTYEQGYLRIKAITAHNLKNTEFFGGKQDPYVIVEFKGTGWKEQTAMQDDAGSDAHWKDLDFRCGGLTRALLTEQDLTVTAMDDNAARGDALIGTASTSLVEAAAQGVLGKEVDIEVELLDGKGSPAGRVVLMCSLHPEAKQLQLAKDLKEGVVKVRKIVARGLETGNRLTRNAPSVHLQYGAWEGSTAVAEGTDPVWDTLTLESSPPVPAAVLSTQPLVVTMIDNGKKFGTGTVDNMLLAGSQPGTDVEVPVQLQHIKTGASVGRLTLTLNVGPPSENVAALAAQEEDLPPPSYKDAVLLISSIRAEGLRNTEWVGKADPFVAMSLGSWADQTEVCSNAGGEVIWNDLKFREEFPVDTLLHQPMEVSVFDKNEYRKNVLLGRGELSLKRVVYSLGREVELVVPLKNEKKTKEVGKLIFKLELREPSKEGVKTLPADFKEGLLHVLRISAFNLPNKELLGKQDPYMVVKLGDYKDRTMTMNEAGSDPIFDLLDLKPQVTPAILQNRQLEVEAWEDNTTGHILLGTGSAVLTKVTTLGEEVELRVNLKNSKGESAGRALVCVRLEPMPLPEEQAATVPISEGFVRGTICIRKIAAFGLANTDLFLTKQDPYVVVKLGGWAAQTRVKDNAGINCLWEETDLECEVDVPLLQTGVFEVTVMNKNNLRAHSEIGAGKVAIRRAGTQVGELVELSVNLVSTKSGKAAGRVVLHAEVIPEEDESKYTMPADFTFGHFKVSKISGFNLKNTEIMGLPDPYIVLKLGEWTAKTYTQDDAPGDVTWNFLTIGCDVMKDVVATQMLEVTAMDENKGRAHALIGTGAVSLMKAAAHLGEEVELKVKLLDAEGKSSGKVVLFGTLAPPEVIAELPDTFNEGALKIKRISVFGLKNSEMLGLAKGDPFVRVKLQSYQADTKVLSGGGENPVWKNLDLETVCDRKTVSVGELTVEAWEKNTLFSDKMLCSCELPIKAAGGKLGQEVELIGRLKTSKGEDRGEVNVLVQLEPIATLSAPDLGLPAGFTVGTVRITKIQAMGLQNKEILQGKQDPYVCVTVGDWSETTDTLSNAGASATWTNLDMVAEINTEILGKEKLTVRVMDENATRRDSVLGVGVASLRKLCARVNTPVEIGVDLASESGAAVGRVVLTAVLSESKLEDLADALPVSAVVVNKAQLVIKSIVAQDLKGGDSSLFGDKPDPYIQLNMDNEWTSKTDFKANAGRSVAWTDITDMELPVTMDILKYKRITVTALDKNSMGKDSWMGKGDFSLRKLGSMQGPPTVVSHTVRLKDKRGRAAGKVIVEALLQPLPEPAAGPATGAALQTVGVLSLLECAVSKVTETAVMGKQDLQVKLALVDWRNTTEVNKAAGTESAWPLKVNSSQVAVAQLLQPGGGLQVEVLGISMKGKSVLGKTTVPLDKAVAQQGTWVDLVADLANPSAGAGSVGKFRVKARFTAAGEGADFGFPKAGDQGYNDLKNSQAELNSRVGSMEESIKAQLHKELAAERDSILQAMAQQNKALSASIENLSKELQRERQAKASVLDGLVISQVNALKLPADVKQWRCAHVQAWISFQMELPQYAEAFQKASIDGLVLIKHVSRDTLQGSLDITDPLHCQKILEGVRLLQEKQKEVDAQAEKERLKKLQAKKEEEERKRALMAELQKQKEKKEKKAKKKPKKAQVEPKTYFGEVREQNVLERTRIEREMRLYRTEKQRQQDAANRASRTWKFEYTGAPQPQAQTIWDSDIFNKKAGSSAYRRTMALDILGSTNFTSADQLPRAPSSIPVRSVPKNCSPEEVLALVKGAMFDVSEWLLEMDRIERRRSAAVDSDLLDANDETFLRLLSGGDQSASQQPGGKMDIDVDAAWGAKFTQGGEESGEDSDSEPPPTFEEVESSSEAVIAGGAVPMAAAAAGNDDEDESLPPPFEDLVGQSFVEPVPSPAHPNTKLMSLIEGGAGDPSLSWRQPEPERMTLIYNALVGQKNNDARWLGDNEKLTRMKLEGGFESLLRLKMDWTQFDALWTQLDHKRSGDIDLREFTAFFGDLADFQQLMGTQTLTTTAKSKSIAALSKCLFELCDALRHAGFTVVEMFSGFDRNGSGGVSISEFCSMLRLVVGNNFEKRLIYQALSVLDTNGDKSISLEEVLRFVYRVWRSQLDELAEKLSKLDEHMTGEAEKIKKIVEERRLIKEAVKKNFPREWRDRLEREGGHAIPGPFQALLQRMNVGTTTVRPVSASQVYTGQGAGSPPRLHTPTLPGEGPQSPQPGHRSYRPSETWSPSRTGPAAAQGGAAGSLFTASAPLVPRSTSAGSKMTARQLSVAGQNEIMRFKIKVPAGCAPTRPGATLRVPAVRDLSAGPINSSEVTDAVLRQNAPFEGYG